MSYRLYIDESGDHNYSDSLDVKVRYLCLTGLILHKDSIEPLRSKIRQLQSLVGDDPEDSKFHGEDIKSGKGIFGVLKTNSSVEKSWNEIIFSIIKEIDFRICGVVLDKKKHKERYGNASLHPYHYCLNLITAGYLLFLEKKSAKGDVMAESRGKREDRLLAEAFSAFYMQGNQFYSTERIQKSITSKSIKIKTKSHGIVGIMLADILALAVKLDILRENNVIVSLRENFVNTLSNLIGEKYVCADDVDIKDFCRKFI